MSRRVVAHRRLVPVVLIFAAACGSQTPTGSTPPPPSPGPPAAISIAAGDGQQALPGSILPVKPAVRVTDAAGAPLAGVLVTFAVDSGGGFLASSTATSGTDGVAVAGNWTLGAAAGSNVIRVSVGTLAVVRIRAQALGPAARPIFANATVSASGGTLTYTNVGDALNGLMVEVPSASYATVTSWSITADSTVHVPLPAGFSQVGPVLIVANGQGYADSAITLTMPMRLAATDAVAPFYFDPVSGTLEPIPILARSDTSAVLVTRHFSRDLLAIPGSGTTLGSLRASLRAGFGSVQVVWVRTPRAQLVGDWSTTFQPGVDDWEFINYGDYLATGGDCTGMSITAMFYHYYFRLGPTPAPGLFHQFDQSLANQWDNVQGIRLVGSVQADYVARIDAGNNQKQALREKFAAKGFTTATLTGDWIVLTLKMTKMPVMLGLSSSTIGHTVVAYAAHTDVTGSHVVVSFADPNQPGQGRTMTFDGGAFTPLSMQDNVLEPSTNFIRIYALAVTTDVPLSQIETRWKEFVAKAAGSDRIPTGYSFIVDTASAMTFGASEWTAMRDIVYAPSGQFLAALMCPSCPFKFPGILPAGRMMAALWDATGRTVLADGSTPLALTAGSTTFAVVGYAASASPPNKFGFLDWKPVTVLYLRGAIAAPPSPQAPNTPVAFTFQFTPNTPPAHVTYNWDFGDGPPVTIVTVVDNPASPHTYTKVGTYAVKVNAVDPVTGQVIATATTATTITEKWSLATFQQVSLTGDPAYPPTSNESRTMSELRDSILARPAGTTLQLFHGGVTLPQGLHELGDFLVRANVDVAAPSMFLSFPRGQPSGGLLAEAVAATGAASSAALGTSAPCSPTCYPVVFTNAMTLGGTPGAVTYVGKAANWVGPMPNSRPCNVVEPTPDPRGKSPVTGYLEINATQGSSGLQGTITFVTPVVNQNGASICVWDTVTEIRRTFAFTAVPAP